MSKQKTMLIIVALCIAALLFVIAMVMDHNSKKLSSIKAKEVGDGQHGNAQWMNENEKKQLFKAVKLPKKLVDKSNEWQPGRIINYDPKSRMLLVDTSDVHADIKAPSGTGKSTKHLIPNVQYNMMAGTSMIIPDLKGEIKKLTEADAQKLGYKTYTFDFVDLIDSCTIDLFDDINDYMDHYMRTGDIISKAKAESAAGELASEITSSRERGSNENKFFLGASRGLNQSVILLMSMFAETSQKHLSSVRATLQNIAAMPKDRKNPSPAIVKLIADMPEDFGPKKQMGAAFAASSETEDNIYASALDDLRPFNDALVEQIISVPQKKGKFSYKDLIEHKSIVYIVLPDEKEEFKTIGKVVLKKIIQQLGNYAVQSPEGRLPRIVKVLWEEFAEYPKIENVGSWLQVKRGQGILFDLIYQDEAALKEKYGDNIPTVLRNNCGCKIILGVAPDDEQYAEKLSKTLGNQTIQSGSQSYNYDNTTLIGSKSKSVTYNMIQKPLLSVDEILRMEESDFQIILVRGHKPLKVKLYAYYTKEWGIKCSSAIEKNAKKEFYKIDYMNFDVLKDKLKEYGEKNNPKPKPIKKEVSFNENAFDDAVKILYEKTKDEKVVEMLKKKNYRDLIKYVTEHHSEKIAKLDLINLLTSITD